MGLFNFFSKSKKNNQQIEFDKTKIVVCSNVNFRAKYDKLILEKLKTSFGTWLDEIYWDSGEEDDIDCQVPTFIFGRFLLDYNIDAISSKMEYQELIEYYKNVLLKQTEVWEKGTRVFYDAIKPQDLIKYLDLILENETDATNYVWTVTSPIHHPYDNYNGLHCKFCTMHTNSANWEYDSEKKDYCKVTERFKDEVIEWIPLTEGKEIKGDNITLVANKVYIDEKMKNFAALLKKLCEIAIEFNIELSKDNDG